MDLGRINSYGVVTLITEVKRRTNFSFIWDVSNAENGLSVSALATGSQGK
ncbi:hypothetical protein [Muricoccus nepalensis]|nr:hypothetical protein [Roseomonas nepalensis]